MTDPANWRLLENELITAITSLGHANALEQAYGEAWLFLDNGETLSLESLARALSSRVTINSRVVQAKAEAVWS